MTKHLPKVGFNDELLATTDGLDSNTNLNDELLATGGLDSDTSKL